MNSIVARKRVYAKARIAEYLLTNLNFAQVCLIAQQSHVKHINEIIEIYHKLTIEDKIARPIEHYCLNSDNGEQTNCHKVYK